MEKELSIYVHIPFCNSKCFYCNFCSWEGSLTTQNRFFNAIEKEIKAKSKNFSSFVVKTIYFGGGTPSVVNEKKISKLLCLIKKNFKISPYAEITIEANPNSLSLQKLEIYKKAGFNRLSIGVQTFNKKSLLYVGRLQTKEQTKEYRRKVISCLNDAKRAGFQNISADFILGLPYQKTREISQFLKQLSPYVTHFSCYMLQVENGTKLYSMLGGKGNENLILEQYKRAVKTLKRLHFHRYEISNFARQNFESEHNKVYWQRKNYVGFGPSASSLIKNTRSTNTSNLNEYIKFLENENPKLMNEPIAKEKLSKEQQAEEVIFLSLRTAKGLNLTEFNQKFYDFNKKNAKTLEKLTNLGLIEFENEFLKLTDKGVLLENSIIVNLI